MEELNVFQVLTDLGYKLKDHGKEYRARPLYRDSDNDSVLRIYKDSGNWVDFKENISGDFATLIKLSLKLETQDQAKTWLKEKNFVGSTVLKDEKPKIKSAKTFDKDLLLKLKTLKLADQNKLDTEVFFDIITDSIDYIYDGQQIYHSKEQTKKELSEFVNNLTTGQFSKIQKFFETMPRLSKEIIWTCKGCNKTHTRKIEGLANFFS